MQNKTFKIGWLFPDSLYLHGDRGNVLALERMARLAGYDVIIEKIDFRTEDFTPTDYDFLFCSPGEIAVFASIIDWLKPYTLALKGYIQTGRPLLVTGNSIGLWGKEILRDDQSVLKGLEIIDVTTKENHAVYGDDLHFTCTVNNETMDIIGSQIQMADFLIHHEKPFGQLHYGYGNTGKDQQEGVQLKNAVFTNTLGPVLVLNPWLTREFVKIMAANQGDDLRTFDCSMDLEYRSFGSKKQFIRQKTSHLTNCPR